MKRSVVMLAILLLGSACDEGASAQAESTPTPETAAAAASAAPSSAKKASDVLTVEAAQEAAKTDPDSLRDKQVKVQGVVIKLGTQTAGKKVTHYIKLASSEDEGAPRLFCDTHDVEPKGVEAGASITVQGRGELQRMKAKDGTTTHRLDLRECKIL